jgi:hypothetical protein
VRAIKISRCFYVVFDPVIFSLFYTYASFFLCSLFYSTSLFYVNLCIRVQPPFHLPPHFPVINVSSALSILKMSIISHKIFTHSSPYTIPCHTVSTQWSPHSLITQSHHNIFLFSDEHRVINKSGSELPFDFLIKTISGECI